MIEPLSTIAENAPSANFFDWPVGRGRVIEGLVRKKSEDRTFFLNPLHSQWGKSYLLFSTIRESHLAMKFIVQVCALLCPLCLSSGAAFGADPPACPEEIRVGLPPVTKDGSFQRLSRDMLAELSDVVGREMVVRGFDTWASNLDHFLAGEVDMGLMTGLGAERALQRKNNRPVAVSEPWPVIAISLETNSTLELGKPDWKHIAVPKGTLAERHARRHLAELHSSTPQTRAESPKLWLLHDGVDEVVGSVLAGDAEIGVITGAHWLAMPPELRTALRVVRVVGVAPGGILMAGPCVSERERAAIATHMTSPTPSPGIKSFMAGTGARRLLSLDRKELLALIQHGNAPMPPVTLPRTSWPEGCSTTVRAVFPPVMSPLRLHGILGQMVADLVGLVGRQASVRFAETYGENVDSLLTGNSDFTFLTGVGLRRALARPDIQLVALTCGWKIVAVARAEGSIRSLEDPELGRVAVQPDTVAWELAMAHLSNRPGYEPESDRWVRYDMLDWLILSVLRGDTDVGLVPSMTPSWLAPPLRESLVEIGTLGDAPGVAFVAGPCVSEEEVRIMSAHLARQSPAPSTALLLDVSGVERFVTTDSPEFRELLARSGAGSPVADLPPSRALPE
jgi:ABC-type phosphate/phosphonate transport system substrate-binding protein